MFVFVGLNILMLKNIETEQHCEIKPASDAAEQFKLLMSTNTLKQAVPEQVWQTSIYIYLYI